MIDEVSVTKSYDEWTGTPNVCGLYQFKVSSGLCSGKVVLMTLPMHDGYTPVLDGNGTAGEFIQYLLNTEFASAP